MTSVGLTVFAVMINQCDTDWRLFYVDVSRDALRAFGYRTTVRTTRRSSNASMQQKRQLDDRDQLSYFLESVRLRTGI